MGRKRVLIVDKRDSEADINRRIKEEKNRDRIIPRLIFIKLLYGGMSAIKTLNNVGVAKGADYKWIKRWNESSFNGLIPRFAGGRPLKLTHDQRKDLKGILELKDLLFLADIVDLVTIRFVVKYSER